MIIIAALLFIPMLMNGMQKAETLSATEKARLINLTMHTQTSNCIEHKIPDDCIIDWPQFFNTLESYATPEQQKEYKRKLLQKVEPFLFNLANRFDQRELVDAAQSQSTDDGKKIITRDESTVITMPEGVPNRLALNSNGTALAINYGNTLQVISKKHQWGNDTCERKQRYPIQSLAFRDLQTVAFTREHEICSFDTKTKKLKSHTKPSFGETILISSNGRYLLHDFINSENKTQILAFRDLANEDICGFDKENNAINGWVFKKFAAHTKGNFVAATESKLLFGHKNNDGSYLIIKPGKKNRPSYIADCDIHNSGNRALIIGLTSFHMYEIGSDSMKYGSLEQTLNAVRFHPSDNTIILATNTGIMILDSETLAWRLIITPSLKAISVSEDGETIAGAGNDAVFILSRKELKKSLSIAELMLIKRLATETSEKVFSATKFIEIFKNIKDPSLQQRLVKTFKLNHQTLGYDECSICEDNFADKVMPQCIHSFCFDCLESWKEQEKATCPLCRREIK